MTPEIAKGTGVKIQRPAPSVVEHYLHLWKARGSEAIDLALTELFSRDFENTDLGTVAVKVAALNGLYATNVYAQLAMAKNIVTLKIGTDLRADEVNPALVERIARLPVANRRFYSFATKYCAMHRPDLYPIFDSLIARVLSRFQRQESFDQFSKGETWRGDYAVFNRSILRFREHFGLEQYNVRDIDKYLWTLAKEEQAGNVTF
ncbi:MAG: hypothetical protein LBH13_00935 [Cellulomonadaceae bacterium]|nr:hypothetical protein [Cellulomonadaceae bacterium]